MPAPPPNFAPPPKKTSNYSPGGIGSGRAGSSPFSPSHEVRNPCTLGLCVERLLLSGHDRHAHSVGWTPTRSVSPRLPLRSPVAAQGALSPWPLPHFWLTAARPPFPPPGNGPSTDAHSLFTLGQSVVPGSGPALWLSGVRVQAEHQGNRVVPHPNLLALHCSVCCSYVLQCAMN